MFKTLILSTLLSLSAFANDTIEGVWNLKSTDGFDAPYICGEQIQVKLYKDEKGNIATLSTLKYSSKGRTHSRQWRDTTAQIGLNEDLGLGPEVDSEVVSGDRAGWKKKTISALGYFSIYEGISLSSKNVLVFEKGEGAFPLAFIGKRVECRYVREGAESVESQSNNSDNPLDQYSGG